MSFRAEPLDAGQLWPKALPESEAFSDRLTRLAEALRTNAIDLAAIQSLAATPAAKARPAWLCAELPKGESATLKWEVLDQKLIAAAGVLADLRQMLKEPLAVSGKDLPNWNVPRPDFRANLVAGQWLNATALAALKRNDLKQAQDSLLALLHLARVYQNDPLLQNQQVRIAVLSLAIPTVWAAMQAPGWSDADLLAISREIEAVQFLPQLRATVECERLLRLDFYQRFRELSYASLEEAFAPRSSLEGGRSSTWPEAGLRAWRHWVFHPLWRYAWSYDDEVGYLRYSQIYVDAAKWVTDHHSWAGYQSMINRHEKSYRPPLAAFRYYAGLPFIHESPSKLRAAAISGYSEPAIVTLFDDALRTITWAEMSKAAIAIKRFQAKHRVVPTSLAMLVPDHLAAVPVDFMDGGALHYRQTRDGSYQLYSVGKNGRDDLGDPYPPRGEPAPLMFFSGRDFVWPTGVEGRQMLAKGERGE